MKLLEQFDSKEFTELRPKLLGVDSDDGNIDLFVPNKKNFHIWLFDKNITGDFTGTLKTENGPGTADYHKPGIKNAKLVVWGSEKSVRAYFFKSKQAATSFAKTVATFKLATPFKLIVSETGPTVFDADNHKLVIRSNFAEQSGINSNKVILLVGTRKQHTRVEQLMRTLGAAE